MHSTYTCIYRSPISIQQCAREQLLALSPHWLRHSSGNHCLPVLSIKASEEGVGAGVCQWIYKGSLEASKHKCPHSKGHFAQKAILQVL